MVYQYQNFGLSTLDEVLDDTETGVDVVNAASFPTSGDFVINVEGELMKVTAVTSNTFTVTRGVEGTSAVSHPMGATVKNVLTADMVANIEGGGTPRGDTFPGSPTTGAEYHRTDIRGGMDFFYDGTRWVSKQIFSASKHVRYASGTGEATDGQVYLNLIAAPGYDVWCIQMDYAYFVNTTNNGSNYWTLDVWDSNNASNIAASFDTSAGTAATWVNGTDTVGSLLTDSEYISFHGEVNKTGSPGSISSCVDLLYRVVAT